MRLNSKLVGDMNLKIGIKVVMITPKAWFWKFQVFCKKNSNFTKLKWTFFVEITKYITISLPRGSWHCTMPLVQSFIVLVLKIRKTIGMRAYMSLSQSFIVLVLKIRKIIVMRAYMSLSNMLSCVGSSCFVLYRTWNLYNLRLWGYFFASFKNSPEIY